MKRSLECAIIDVGISRLFPTRKGAKTMSEKRRDNRNRILRSGESQRKDGRYAYKYTDTFGKVQFVYAWKLVPTDKTPAGKRDDISLRACLKSGGMPDRGGFFRWTRRFDAGILCVFPVKSTRASGKRCAGMAF